MTRYRTVTGTAPSHWASYLINGDASGIMPDDIAQADKFAEFLGATPMDCTDAGFMWSHDAMRVCGALAADCRTYSALVPIIPVLFRMERNGECLAVFPTIPAAKGECTCYAHMGQHSGMSPAYFADTKPATQEQSKPLLLELMRIGYHGLREYKRRAPWMAQERQQAEKRP
jgi:hypothetical protein